MPNEREQGCGGSSRTPGKGRPWFRAGGSGTVARRARPLGGGRCCDGRFEQAGVVQGTLTHARNTWAHSLLPTLSLSTHAPCIQLRHPPPPRPHHHDRSSPPPPRRRQPLRPALENARSTPANASTSGETARRQATASPQHTNQTDCAVWSHNRDHARHTNHTRLTPGTNTTASRSHVALDII